MSYNGYANYQTWNVCLWISNDEGLNKFASTCEDYTDFRTKLHEGADAAIAFETPDCVAWNDSGIDMQEMRTFWEENFSRVGA